MRDNLDDELNEHLKIEDKRIKKARRDKHNVNEKGQLRKYKEKGKKDMCDNLDDEQEEHLRIEDKKRKRQSVITLMLMKNNS